MGPLELVWAVLIAVFTVVGLVRGYPKELGVTTTILAALLILAKSGESILRVLDSYAIRFGESTVMSGAQSGNLIQSMFYVIVFGVVVFVSYHGETLAFAGEPPKGPLGVMLNGTSGLLNGYLIAGTMWYYLHIFNYPVQMFGLFQPPLTEFAQTYLLPLMPVPLLEPYLLLLVPFMIVMRVLR